jgi:hypothetical protein
MIMLSNGNGQGQVPVSPECALRREVFSLLGRSKTSVQQDLKILSQAVSHLRNTALIGKAARASKLKISGFRVNDALELYYDIKRGHSEMGYVSKGWEDPGFRIGDLLVVPRSKAGRFKTCLSQIRTFCAANGIAMTVTKTRDSIEIQMDGVIYSDGFNKKTFLSTLDTLHECVEKAKELIG